MTRLFLAAGVAALAIAAPAASAPGGHGGHGGQAFMSAGGGGGGQRAEREKAREERQQARAERAPRAERQQVRAERQPRAERQQMRAERQPRIERQQMRAERQARVERQPRIERQQVRAERQARLERQQVRADRQARVERQARIERQQVRNERVARIERQQVRNERIQRADNQMARHELRAQRQMRAQDLQAQRQEFRANRQEARALRVANNDAFRASRLAALTVSPRERIRILAPAEATRFVGVPFTTASNTIRFVSVPQSISYLYPDTDDYYYRYGDGYLYRVDRDDNLISWILPLLAGGFMPGSYLPNSYMNSYAPSYWGLNSFYPATYSGFDYGYGYDNLCNRYANGVIYRVDCLTGLVVDVVPMYAGGYGVGQLLPSAYSYYNVPSQYRSLYYDTPDYGYWYAPGAIYQYDRDTSLISSVAALLSPGFSIGQPLPMGYSVYNVPYGYRQTYFDTPNAWYRYNNGYIYQVDPTTQLVTAIVASLLT